MVRKKPALNQSALDFDVKPRPEQLMSPDEIFERADESLLRRIREDRRVEWKPSKYACRGLGEYISMWSNTSPDGGIVVCGMSDDGTVEGCKHLSQEALNNLNQAAYVYCPEAKCRTKHVGVPNKAGEADFVVMFRVEYHPHLVVKTSSGKAFHRIGDSKIELKPEQIRELQIDKGEVNFEQGDCTASWPGDFDAKAISDFVATVKNKRGLSDALTTDEVLDIRHLGRLASGVFRPNHACLLLFGKDPVRWIPGCKIHFQRFDGEHEGTGDKYNAVKDEIREGCVPDLIRQVESLLDSQLRTFSPLDATGRFYPLPEYPKAAWYEAIVNACVHRSYGNGMKNMVIFVKMFDDRLVVESPGPFPPFVTPENIYDTHSPRNPQLMDAMFYLQYVKCAHEGTRRMRDTMSEMRLPNPEFSQKQSQIGSTLVRVTLRNNIKQRREWIDRDVSRVVGEAIAEGFSEDERRVVNWVAEHGTITVSDANKLLGKGGWQTARKLLFGLTDRRVFQYIRFRPFEKNKRDSKAFFRLRSTAPLPEGGFEQAQLKHEEPTYERDHG